MNVRNKRRERAHKRALFEQLRLQAEILCDTHIDDPKGNVVLNRMMSLILQARGKKQLNDNMREAIANHFKDCSYGSETKIELGWAGDRNSLYLDGDFDLEDLSKRIQWTETRTRSIEHNEADEWGPEYSV